MLPWHTAVQDNFQSLKMEEAGTWDEIAKLTRTWKRPPLLYGTISYAFSPRSRQSSFLKENALCLILLATLLLVAWITTRYQRIFKCVLSARRRSLLVQPFLQQVALLYSCCTAGHPTSASINFGSKDLSAFVFLYSRNLIGFSDRDHFPNCPLYNPI